MRCGIYDVSGGDEADDEKEDIMYVCNNDRYCAKASTFESCAEFVSYCQAVFNERPALISRNCGDQYVDQIGTVVLTIVSEDVR